MLRVDPLPGMSIRGFCSSELDAPDNADCTGRIAAPLASSLLFWLLPASLELWECLLASGDVCEGARGEAVRRDAGACAGGDDVSSARRFDDEGLVFFRRRFG